MSQHHLHMPSSYSDAPWNTPWPSNDLEHLSVCPVCESAERFVLHEGLIDNVFHCAPGKWTSWHCMGCHCAYLDPRPSRASIHLAYASYYTHQDAAPKNSYTELSPFRKLGRRLVNGYTNWRYSTRETPAATLIGPLVYTIFWSSKMMLDREYRHLPWLPTGGGKLLDIGCGNGDFLQKAKSCGWNVFGIDPDPSAIACGLRLGLNVRQGSIEHFDSDNELFDVITLSHVIEHVHDPVTTLKAAYRLLRPGGQIWLETPNIDSRGYRYYKKNWRGLEPPRHLVLFNRDSLTAILSAAGFVAIRTRSDQRPLLSITKASEKIKCGLRIDDDLRLSPAQLWNFKKNELIEKIFPQCKEFLTLVASKKFVVDE